MNQRILGLDPGLARLGFGAIACPAAATPSLSPRGDRSLSATLTIESVQVIDFGVIQTPAKTAIGKRLHTIYEDLHTVIREIRPDLVALEKLFFYKMSSTITVAQARGVVLLVLAQAELPIVEFTPAQIKQALTGYGNADKHEVQAAVARELELDSLPRPDDAADALAIALAAWFSQ